MKKPAPSKKVTKSSPLAVRMKEDKRIDKARGHKEGSPADLKQDRKLGIKD